MAPQPPTLSLASFLVANAAAVLIRHSPCLAQRNVPSYPPPAPLPAHIISSAISSSACPPPPPSSNSNHSSGYAARTSTPRSSCSALPASCSTRHLSSLSLARRRKVRRYTRPRPSVNDVTCCATCPSTPPQRQNVTFSTSPQCSSRLVYPTRASCTSAPQPRGRPRMPRHWTQQSWCVARCLPRGPHPPPRVMPPPPLPPPPPPLHQTHHICGLLGLSFFLVFNCGGALIVRQPLKPKRFRVLCAVYTVCVAGAAAARLHNQL
jgi:hypothetical protein